jgi:hypothetical protein
MLIMTHDQFLAQVAFDLEDGDSDVQEDASVNHQLIIYTKYFYWHDNTIRDEPDPEYQDDPTDA